MKKLYDEIRRQFPEIPKRDLNDDIDNSTMLMHSVIWWLRDLGPSGISPDIERRVVAFARWCEAQPRDETAADDLYTKFVVSFFEDLFSSEITRPLIPKIYDYNHMIENAEYLKTWVGQGDYELALKEFKEHGRPPSNKRRKRLGSRKRK